MTEGYFVGTYGTWVMGIQSYHLEFERLAHGVSKFSYNRLGNPPFSLKSHYYSVYPLSLFWLLGSLACMSAVANLQVLSHDCFAKRGPTYGSKSSTICNFLSDMAASYDGGWQSVLLICNEMDVLHPASLQPPDLWSWNFACVIYPTCLNSDSVSRTCERRNAFNRYTKITSSHVWKKYLKWCHSKPKFSFVFLRSGPIVRSTHGPLILSQVLPRLKRAVLTE